MKIYDFLFAPNPRKLRVYLADVTIDPAFENLTRWYTDFRQRPSAKA